MPLLDARNLSKSFRGRGRVVHDVSFSVEPGEVVGLLGLNGAGKTTSFRMTVGMIRPDAGSVTFLGTDITDFPMYRRARLGLGYLSQEPSIFRNLTVEENLLAVLETRPFDRRRRRELLEAHLDELGLTRLRKSLARSLSGGEKRRLEITRSLVTSPRLLLLDEPFAGVDPIAVADIQEIVTRLRSRGISVLLTDHSVRATLEITDRAYIINEGRILRQGTSRELVHDPVVKKVYLGEKFQMPELESHRAESDPERLGGGPPPGEPPPEGTSGEDPDSPSAPIGPRT